MSAGHLGVVERREARVAALDELLDDQVGRAETHLRGAGGGVVDLGDDDRVPGCVALALEAGQGPVRRLRRRLGRLRRGSARRTRRRSGPGRRPRRCSRRGAAWPPRGWRRSHGATRGGDGDARGTPIERGCRAGARVWQSLESLGARLPRSGKARHRVDQQEVLTNPSLSPGCGRRSARRRVPANQRGRPRDGDAYALSRARASAPSRRARATSAGRSRRGRPRRCRRRTSGRRSACPSWRCGGLYPPGRSTCAAPRDRRGCSCSCTRPEQSKRSGPAAPYA